MPAAFVAMRTRGNFVPTSHGPTRTGAFAALGAPRSGGFSNGVVPSAAVVKNSAVPTEFPTPAAEPTPAVTASTDVVNARIAELEAELIRRDQARQVEHESRIAELEIERQKLHAASTRVGSVAGELVRARVAMIDQFKSAAGSLLLAGARRLAGESLSAQPELLANRANELAALLGDGDVRVRVNPADHAALAPLLPDSMSLVSDTNVGAGCIVESSHGSVDGSVSTAGRGLDHQTAAWRKSA